MVNAIGVEVLGHLAETFHPPCITVLLHHIPIVSRESPVLPVHRKIIGRSTGLSVQIEIVRFFPGFHTVAADADRNVTFQHYTMCTGVLGSCQQLLMQIELYVIIDGNACIHLGSRIAKRLDFIGLVHLITGPFAEVRCAVRIAQIAKCCIRKQPLTVGLEETFEFVRSQNLLAFLLEYQTEVVPLGTVYGLVVHSRQSVEFFLPSFEVGHQSGILQTTQLLQVSIHRMESINGDAVIRIRVDPRMRHGCIIDRQNLHNLLTGLYNPVYHTFQVTEVTHTKTLLGTKREYGHSYACSLPCRKVEVNVTVAYNQCLARSQLRIGLIAVRIIFPGYSTLFFLIVQNKLVFQGESQLFDIQVNLPFGKISISHQDSLIRIPIAQCFLIAANTQAMVGIDTRRISLDQDTALVTCYSSLTLSVCQQRFGKCRSIKILLFGQILPTVIQVINFFSNSARHV